MLSTPDGIGVNQKIIGVLAVAPWSALDFLKVLYDQLTVEKDWHYPRIICDINTKIPSRGRHFELGEEDFTPYINKNLESLKEQGAEILVVACNTAHIYFDKWSNVTGVDVLSITDVCASSLKNIGHQLSDFKQHTAVVFSGYSLWKTNLYQDSIRGYGINIFELSEEEARLINSLINCIKINGVLNDSILLGNLTNLLLRLKENHVDTIVLGCTELTKIEQIANKYIKNIIDSNMTLAQAIIRKI